MPCSYSIIRYCYIRIIIIIIIIITIIFVGLDMIKIADWQKMTRNQDSIMKGNQSVSCIFILFLLNIL